MIITGSETYRQVHRRLRHERGSASKLVCTDCGAAAEEWSFNRDAESEQEWCWEVYKGYWTPYSMLTAHYDPRCVKCHRQYDRGVVT